MLFAALVPAFVALVIVFAFLFSSRAVNEAREKGGTARQIMHSMNELNSLARSYMLFHENRSRLQFVQVLDSLTDLVRAAGFAGAEQQRILENIRRESELMRDAFLKLVSNYENRGSIQNAALFLEAEERLAGRILIRSRDVLSNAVRLESLIDADITTTRSRTSTLVFILLVATILPLTILLLRMKRNITLSLATLRKGTEIVAAGHLGHRIGLPAPDEVGELAGAFDLMTEQLRNTTVSRDVLSKEVEERKRAEEHLRRNREWLRVTLTSIGDAVMATDTSGRITFMNPVASSLSGWQPEEAMGRPIREVLRTINERTHEPGEDIVRRVLDEGSIIQMANHTALVTRDGREVPIEDSAAPIKDGEGKVSGVVVVFHDVTERRAVLTALRESEERLRLAAQSAALGVFEWNVVADRAKWENARMYEIFGRSREDGPLSKAAFFEDVLHPEDAGSFEAALGESVKPGGLFRPVCRIRRKNDGEWRWIEYAGRFELAGDGSPQRLIGVLADITERKKATSEAEEGKRILDAIMEYIPEGITIADVPDVSIRMISRYGLQLMGRIPAMTAGIPMEDFRQTWNIFRPDGKTRYLDEELPLSRAIRKGEVVVEEEVVLARQDGVMIPLLCNAGPIKDRSGSIIGGILAWRDIARMKEAQKELEDFTYSVSHDLRTPLRAIAGFTRMILDETGAAFDQETSRKFGIIQQNVQKMGQLIDDLLKLSRLSRVELRRSSIDMGRLAREVVEELREAEPERRLEVGIHELPPAHGDPTLVRQLIVNLLSNAAKFTRQEEKPMIEIGSLERYDERIYYVMDNGVGFDMKYYDKLFGVFQRLVSEKQFEGTGAGLAIARRVVQRHGGRIWAEGKPRGGATFYFTLSEKQKR